MAFSFALFASFLVLSRIQKSLLACFSVSNLVFRYSLSEAVNFDFRLDAVFEVDDSVVANWGHRTDLLPVFGRYGN